MKYLLTQEEYDELVAAASPSQDELIEEIEHLRGSLQLLAELLGKGEKSYGSLRDYARAVLNDKAYNSQFNTGAASETS